jgi:hypothetical protein
MTADEVPVGALKPLRVGARLNGWPTVAVTRRKNKRVVPAHVPQ